MKAISKMQFIKLDIPRTMILSQKCESLVSTASTVRFSVNTDYIGLEI